MCGPGTALHRQFRDLQASIGLVCLSEGAPDIDDRGRLCGITSTFYGTLVAPKITWIESASAGTVAPLDCEDDGNDVWECFE